MDQDTPPAAKRRYLELLRSKTGPERLEIACALTAAAREMTRIGLRQRYPEASEPELRYRFVEIVYGRDVADRLRPRL